MDVTEGNVQDYLREKLGLIDIEALWKEESMTAVLNSEENEGKMRVSRLELLI
jgi:hypothetical protein